MRYNEAPHVKHLKVDLLPLITNPGNARDIASELSEYVTDVDAELSKRAIKSIGEVSSFYIFKIFVRGFVCEG